MTSITDHYERAVARLAEQLRDIPEVIALIRAKCRQTQDLEDAIAGMLAALGVDNAPLPLLKLYAKIVGLIPGSRTLDSLRRNVKALVKLNMASGTVPEVLAIVRLLIPDTATIAAQEGRAQLAVSVAAYAMPDDVRGDISSLLHRAKLGGVRAFLEWATGTDALSFVADNDAGTAVGLGLGDDSDPSIGGVLGDAEVA